ncbi:MAG: hypothetical protein LC793_03505, partial [Thermomicrobia bacterium]|nr:hypothetical protein [Thermomicrobia bacterium]
EFPQLGRQRTTNEEGRELIGPPYIISYQIVGDTVFILDNFSRAFLAPRCGSVNEQPDPPLPIPPVHGRLRA